MQNIRLVFEVVLRIKHFVESKNLRRSRYNIFIEI